MAFFLPIFFTFGILCSWINSRKTNLLTLLILFITNAHLWIKAKVLLVTACFEMWFISTFYKFCIPVSLQHWLNVIVMARSVVLYSFAFCTAAVVCNLMAGSCKMNRQPNHHHHRRYRCLCPLSSTSSIYSLSLPSSIRPLDSLPALPAKLPSHTFPFFLSPPFLLSPHPDICVAKSVYTSSWLFTFLGEHSSVAIVVYYVFYSLVRNKE